MTVNINKNIDFPLNATVLDDLVKLRQLYWDEGFNIRHIARLLGISTASVYRAMLRHNIERRRADYPVLRDKDHLYKLYWIEQQSISQVATKLGCSEGSVRHWLKKHNIPTRTLIEVAKVHFSNDLSLSYHLQQFLVGSMLGDGHLRPGAVVSSYAANSKHREYINHLESLFQGCGYKTSTYVINSDNKIVHNLYVEGSNQLQILRVKWYPKGGKIVPKDIDLTPTTCLYWYIEDGSLRIRSGSKKRSINGIYLSTESFTVEEIELLIEKLKMVLNLSTGMKKRKSSSRGRFFIALHKLPALNFLEYIGGVSPVRCYDYKFDPMLRAPLTENKKRALRKRKKKM